MSMCLSWEEIAEKYPDQWVGLKNVTWKDEATVAKAEVCFTEKDMSSDEMALLAVQGKIDAAKYTTPDKEDSVGALMMA